jgi:hypothetical protein
MVTCGIHVSFCFLNICNIFAKNNAKLTAIKKSRQQTANRQQTIMKPTATPEQKKSVKHYENNLIKLLHMPEDEHFNIIVEDGACPKLMKSRLQKIRSHLVIELRNIQRWRKDKPLN